jgi:hypothetical protein
MPVERDKKVRRTSQFDRVRKIGVKVQEYWGLLRELQENEAPSLAKLKLHVQIYVLEQMVENVNPSVGDVQAFILRRHADYVMVHSIELAESDIEEMLSEFEKYAPPAPCIK